MKYKIVFNFNKVVQKIKPYCHDLIILKDFSNFNSYKVDKIKIKVLWLP